MGQYHFFIAYAGPDFRQARALWFQLKDELKDESNKVFFDRHQIRPGDPWPARLSQALEASRAIVVLISSHTEAAFYQQEEIARAIQLARQQPERYTIIPVLLETLPKGPVKMPTWGEVQDYIADYHTHASAATVEALREEYQRLTSGQYFSYQQLADMIDRYLQDA